MWGLDMLLSMKAWQYRIFVSRLVVVHVGSRLLIDLATHPDMQDVSRLVVVHVGSRHLSDLSNYTQFLSQGLL